MELECKIVYDFDVVKTQQARPAGNGVMLCVCVCVCDV